MEMTQELEERIDSYLSGKMSEIECEEFELEIKQNPQLRKEVDLQRDIISAIKAKNIKKILEKKEQEVRKRQFRHKLSIRTISGVAAAACILIAVLITNNNSSHYKSCGNYYYAEFSLPAVRSANKPDSLLLIAYQQIGNEDYKLAINNIDAAIEMLQHETFDTSTEEGEYYQEITKIKTDEAEWLKAIIFMKQGKKHKAKKILKEIAESDSDYCTIAKDVLG